WIECYMISPTKNCVGGASEHRSTDTVVGPFPEAPKDLVMMPQQIARDQKMAIDPKRQGMFFHAVTDAEHTLLVEVAFLFVALSCGVFRYGFGRFGESQIRIARGVGGLHRFITGKSGSNCKFFADIVDVRQAAARWRFYQSARPGCRPENAFG